MPATSASTPVSLHPVCLTSEREGPPEPQAMSSTWQGDDSRIKLAMTACSSRVPPTLLAYILAVDFTSNAGSNFAPKSSILRSIEFKAIGRVALSDSTFARGSRAHGFSAFARLSRGLPPRLVITETSASSLPHRLQFVDHARDHRKADLPEARILRVEAEGREQLGIGFRSAGGEHRQIPLGEAIA